MPHLEPLRRLGSYAPELSDEEKAQLLGEFKLGQLEQLPKPSSERLGQIFRPSRTQVSESFGLSEEEKAQLLGEFKRGRERQRLERPVEPEEPTGPGLASKAVSVVGGGILGAGETWGRAIRALPGGEEAGVGEEGISGAILKTTRGMREYLPEEPEDPGAIYQGIQSAITSIVSRLPQMAAGAAAGFLSPIPGGTFLGMLGGYVFGGAPLFGMAEYDSFIENAVQSDRYKQGLITREQIEEGAIKSGLHETGWEYASDILTGAITLATGGIGAPVGKAGMTALKEWAKTTFKASGKEMAKRAGAIIAGEVSTEMATAGFQTEELYKLGLTDQRFTDGMTQAFGPAFVASLIFAGFFEGGVRLNRKATKNALENPDVSIEQRMGAVDYVHGEMSQITPEIADTWKNLATQAIKNNEAITLDERIIDEASELYSNKIFAPERQQLLKQEWEAAETERLKTPEGRQEVIEAEMPSAPATPMTTISEEITNLAEMAPEKAEERMAGFGRIPTGEIIGEEERIAPEIVTPAGRPVEAERLEDRIMTVLEKDPALRTGIDRLLLQELMREEGAIEKPAPAPMRAFGMRTGKRSPVEMSEDIADEIVKTEKELSDEEYATFWKTNLNKLDYLYKSPQGLIKLRKQLEAEETAGNIAPEYATWWGKQLDRIDQIRQSVIGAEGLKEELAAKETVGKAFGMKPGKKKVEVVKPEKIEIPVFTNTTQAITFGEKATPEQITELKKLRKESETRYHALTEEGKLDEAGEEALKAQLYREAFETAEKVEKPEVKKLVKEIVPEKIEEKKPYKMTLAEIRKEPDILMSLELRQLHEHKARTLGFEKAGKSFTEGYLKKLAEVAGETDMSAATTVYEALSTYKKGDITQAFLAAEKILGKLHKAEKKALTSDKISEMHKKDIQQALKEGKTISKKVLAEYPDLVPAKPLPSKPAKPKPKKAVTEQIKAKGIPKPIPKSKVGVQNYEKGKTELPVDKNWIAVEFNDGRIIYDEKLSTHSQLILKAGVRPGEIREGGWITPEGYKKTTSDVAETARKIREAKKAEKKVEVTPEKKIAEPELKKVSKPETGVRPQISDAYFKITEGAPNVRVKLADLFTELDMSHKEFSKVLREMQADDQATLYPLDFKPEITTADKKAAIDVGGEANHIVYMGKVVEKPAKIEKVAEVTPAEFEGIDLSKITVEVESIRAKTGEVIKVETNAETAIKEADEDIAKMRKILECL